MKADWFLIPVFSFYLGAIIHNFVMDRDPPAAPLVENNLGELRSASAYAPVLCNADACLSPFMNVQPYAVTHCENKDGLWDRRLWFRVAMRFDIPVRPSLWFRAGPTHCSALDEIPWLMNRSIP